MSVPARRGPWWYYSRTEEGQDYGIHCRRACPRPPDELPAGRGARRGRADPARRERAGRGHGYFAVGSAAVSHDHHWLAYATDRPGQREVRAALPPPRRRDGTCPRGRARDRVRLGLVCRRRLRLLRTHGRGAAALPAVASPAGHRPGRRRARLRGARRRFSLGDGRTRDGAFVAHRTAQHQHHRVARHPHRRTARRAPSSCSHAARASSTAIDHLTPAGGGRGWFLALTNDGGRGLPRPGRARRALGTTAPAARLARGGRPPARRPHRGRRRLRRRPGPQRAHRGPDPGAGPARLPERRPGRSDDPFGPTCCSRAGSCRPSRARRRPGWGPTPSRTRRRCASGARRWSPPRVSCRSTLDEREETLLKQEPVLGDFDAGRYTTYRDWAAAPDGTSVPLSVVHRQDLELPAPRASSTATAPTRSASTRRSPRTGCRCSTAASSSRSRTCAAAARWAGLVRGRADGAQAQHLLGLHRLRPPPRRHRHRRPRSAGGRGGSAGGLLIGAVANQAPELFRALVAEVPFVDCVTTMLDDELPLTVGEWEEWGNPPADEAAYRACSATRPTTT